MPTPESRSVAPPGAHDECPVKPLGLTGNHFLLLDFAGIERLFPASVLHSRDGLLDLFGGQRWLLDAFPKQATTQRRNDAGEYEPHTITVGFYLGDVAEWLIEGCHAAEAARASALAVGA